MPNGPRDGNRSRKPRPGQAKSVSPTDSIPINNGFDSYGMSARMGRLADEADIAIPISRDILLDWLLIIALLLVGMGLRLGGLGGLPLGPTESQNALESWSIYRGIAASASASPLLIYGNSLVFYLFGANDTTARLLPALVGTALAILPLFLQRELGRLGARLAVAFLAISPNLVFHSRLAEPGIFAAFGAMLLIVGLGQFAENERRGRITIASALAILLVSGPTAYYALFAFGFYYLLRVLLTRSARLAPNSPFWPILADRQGRAANDRDRSSLFPRLVTKEALFTFLAVLALLSTGFFSSLAGIGAGAFDGLLGFFRSLTLPSGQQPTVYTTTLILYEPLALVFGLVGAIYFARSNDAFAGLLTWYALFLFAMGTLGAGRPLDLVPQIVAALGLITALYLPKLFARLAQPSARSTLFWVGSVAFVLTVGTTVGINHLSTPDPAVPDTVLLAAVVLIAGALTFGLYRIGPRTLAWGLGAYLALILTLVTLRGSFYLAHPAQLNPLIPGIGAVSSENTRTLYSDLVVIRRTLAMNSRDNEIQLAESLSWPLLWTLRDFSPRVVSNSAPSDGANLVLLPVDSKPPSGGAYTGGRYRVTRAANFELSGWKSLWRYIAYRESLLPPKTQDAILYVRTQQPR